VTVFDCDRGLIISNQEAKISAVQHAIVKENLSKENAAVIEGTGVSLALINGGNAAFAAQHGRGSIRSISC
jgi:hypothetical protein